MGKVSSLVSQSELKSEKGYAPGLLNLFHTGFKEVLRGLTGYVTPIFSRKVVVTMGATNRMLAKRVDELTEALAEVRENAKEVKEADDMAEVTASADEIIESVDEAIGSEEDDKDSEEEEEEFGGESDEGPEEEE